MTRSDGASAGEVLRSLLFYAVFYFGSVFVVLACLITLLLTSRETFRATVDSWSLFHRWCLRHILRITIRVEGALPPGRVFVAMKHESFFEAIDLPQVLPFPGVFAKAELMRIPLWGLAGNRYGLVTVEREQGARTLRHMMTAAKAISGEGRPLAIFPEGSRTVHGTRPEIRVRGDLQAARLAGGADRGRLRAALPPTVEARRGDHLSDRTADSAGPAARRGRGAGSRCDQRAQRGLSANEPSCALR
jgi:1-acyl-sn-glycerol-3-phosphate acyltransferase